MLAEASRTREAIVHRFNQPARFRLFQSKRQHKSALDRVSARCFGYESMRYGRVRRQEVQRERGLQGTRRRRPVDPEQRAYFRRKARERIEERAEKARDQARVVCFGNGTFAGAKRHVQFPRKPRRRPAAAGRGSFSRRWQPKVWCHAPLPNDLGAQRGCWSMNGTHRFDARAQRVPN